MRVRLVKKLASTLNGIDLSKFRVGRCVEVPDKVARMLLLEGWAERVEPQAQADDCEEAVRYGATDDLSIHVAVLYTTSVTACHRESGS